MAGPAIPWPFGATSQAMKERVSNAKVLAVGAGGIGCELLKTLVMSGFRNIEVIDLDTIEVSNLNRQFLFRKQHVGHSKAEVAVAAVRQARPSASVTAHHGNVKDSPYSVDFFRRFDLVLNGLDNLDARRHVNRMCLAAGVPLVESGTAGYLGQVTVHVGGKTECFECQPKPAPKTFAICTIRNTPDKPVHCIEWAKAHLLPLLFGPADAATDVDQAAGEAPLARAEGEGAAAFAARVFGRVFGSDVAKLASVEGMWKGRRPPVPLDLDAILPGGAASEAQRGVAGTACTALGLSDQHLTWDAGQNAAVFLEATRRFLEERADEVGAITFDKDDELAVEFVTAASNLRSLCYSIPPQTLFDAKGMAGNIIHAIATTNAVISGLIVVEALKLLAAAGDPAACKSTFLRQDLSNRRLVTPVGCVPPSAACCVCSKAQLTLHIDTEATTFRDFLDRVLRGHLGLVSPTVGADNAGYENSFDYVEGEGLDASEAAEKQAHLPKALAALPAGGISHNSMLDVGDQMQQLDLSILVVHQAEWDEELHPQRFVLSGSAPKAEPEPEAAAAAESLGAENGVAPAAEAAAGKGVVVVSEGEDEVLEIVDSEDGVVPAAAAAAGGSGKRKATDSGDAAGAHKGKRTKAANGKDEDIIVVLD